MNLAAPNIVSLTIVTSKENFSRIYVINGSSNLEKNISMVKDVFSRNDIKDFLVGFKQLIDTIGSGTSEDELANSSWVVALEQVGENKILLVDLSKLDNDSYIFYLNKSVWTNPKDMSEKQVSFEAYFYAKNGIVKDFQRVLIIRGNLIYDAPLKK